MAAGRVGSEFDSISAVYDATREPLEPASVDSIVETLRAWGIRRLLEVGVGTGRVARPLRAHGLDITGIDPSRGMLAKARAKGLDRLVRGSAYALPWADASFDTCLFVHVLHVLDDPARALREACRVGRDGATALVNPRTPRRGEDEDAMGPRRLVVEHLRHEGIDVPDRARGGPAAAERRLLDEHPPDQSVVVGERDVTEPLAARLTIFERGASRWTLCVPPDALARAVAAARAAVGDRTHTYHRVLALARWERPPGPALVVPSPE